MTDKRKHRTPFTYRPLGDAAWGIYSSNGTTIGTVETRELAKFVCLACNNFDHMAHVIGLCRGLFENTATPSANPAYRDLMETLARLNNARNED